MRRAVVLLLGLGAFWANVRADEVKGRITHDVMVGASNEIPLKAGELVEVMKESGPTDVIMAAAPDGSEGVYQIDAGAVAVLPASPAASPPPATHPVAAAPASAPILPPAIAAPPPPAPTAPSPAAAPALSGFAAQLQGHLVALDNGELKDFDASALQGVKYWAVYFSASWCPYCAQSTPDIVRFYHIFKADHPNFELILVCHDKTADDMLAYLKNDDMSWPALRFDDRFNTHLWPLKYMQRGIPNLVLVDDSGKILSQTYRNGVWGDPEKVVDDIKTMVPDATPQL